MAALLRVLLLWECFCFSGGEGFQVIRPIRIHSLTKRHAEPGRPSRLDYVFPVGGQQVHLQLTKNTELLTRDYTETFYREDRPITTAPDDIDDCYYHGQVVNDSQSAASISTCDGLRGYIRTAAQRFLIEPLGGGDQGDHALTPVTGGDHALTPVTGGDPAPTPVAGGDPAPTPVAGGDARPGLCGVTNTSWGDDFEPPTGRSRSRAAGASIVQQEKFIQLLLVADNRMYQKMDGDEAALRKRVFEIVNFVNMAYRPLRTFVALVGLEVWSSRDQISVTTSAGENLENFRNWRNSDLMKRKPHDNAHLLSGIDFDGATLGLAYVGTLCSGSSVGVVQDHSNRAIAMAATLAHEMGHNLGMSHDDSSGCTCPAQSCIMEAALSWNAPRSFSSCSSSNYERYQLERSPECLLDKPDYRSLEGPGVCGNGFLERGEQCDCGSLEECRDPCCNATSCLLVGGAQCSAGECCQDCKVAPPSRECRPRRDVCDLPEFCDGRGPDCPEDVFAANGLTCSGGFCRDGRCPQRGAQCMQLYGAGATEAPPSCYKQNTRGTNFGYCRRISDVQFVPCQQEDLLCGKLYCLGGNPNPSSGRKVTIGSCKAAFYSQADADQGQVEEGSLCGGGKVCSQNQCMDLQAAYGNANCSARCPGHAVCNHRNECQCEPGWLPPRCATQDQAFSALSTGATVAVGVSVLLVALGLVLGAAGVLWRRRNRPTIPSSQRKQQGGSTPVISPPQAQAERPKRAPPPPPPAGNRPKPQNQNYTAARQALRPVPPPKV